MSNPGVRPSAEPITFGQFTLVPAERLLKFKGSPLCLGSRAMDILTTLVEQAGTVVTKKELIARVWPDLTVDEGGLRFQIAAVRKVLKDGQNGSRYIANVPGRGYCFVAPVLKCRPLQLKVAETEKRSRPYRLPPRVKRMVGRDGTVRELSVRLLEQQFVTITGAGGMGKTTVAISVACDLVPTFANAVWFVDFSEIANPDLVPSVLAKAFGIRAPAPDLLRRLSAFVRDRRLLLVLDNCEHVVGAVATLAEKLFNCAPGLHILATSREALRADGEQVFHLEPLSSPPPGMPLSAAETLTYPAVQLFIERVAASGNHIRLGDAEARIVSGICSRVDGIALAIELAAGRVGAHGLAGTADLLDNRVRLYWQGRRTAPPRHQTLRALLDWSYNLLSDSERSILRRLSVFANGFTLEAACAVAADAETSDEMIVDIIGNLVGKSLVSTEIDASGSAIYRLFEMTRAYALEKLAQNNEADAVARQHAAHFSRLFASVTAKELASARTVKRRDTNFTSPKCALHWNGCSGRRMPRVSAWSSPPVSSPCP